MDDGFDSVRTLEMVHHTMFWFDGAKPGRTIFFIVYDSCGSSHATFGVYQQLIRGLEPSLAINTGHRPEKVPLTAIRIMKDNSRPFSLFRFLFPYFSCRRLNRLLY
jgi:hypothetical protein